MFNKFFNRCGESVQFLQGTLFKISLVLKYLLDYDSFAETKYKNTIFSGLIGIDTKTLNTCSGSTETQQKAMKYSDAYKAIISFSKNIDTNLNNSKKVLISFESHNWKLSVDNTENISWIRKTRITEITAENFHQT